MTATAPRFRIEFEPADHSYTLDGQDAPTVTGILEAEGLSGCAFWKEEHRDRGTAVHKIAHILGKRPWRGNTVEEIVGNSLWNPVATTRSLVGYGYAVAKMYLETGFMPELVEQPVGSRRFGVCGTLDQYGVMPSSAKRLVDFKSGQPQEAAHVQVAIYDMCLEETLGLKTDERVVVWLKPDGDYKIVLPKLAPAVYMNAGQCAVNLFRWRQQFKKLG